MADTDDLADTYRFRTPSLHNIALTSPYGRNGAYRTLERIVRHHLNPSASQYRWIPEHSLLPDIYWLNNSDFLILKDVREMQRFKARLDIDPASLSDGEVGNLLAFLRALTGKTARNTPLGRPESVPSGLTVD